jgi:hypothetical protein
MLPCGGALDGGTRETAPESGAEMTERWNFDFGSVLAGVAVAI